MPKPTRPSTPAGGTPTKPAGARPAKPVNPAKPARTSGGTGAAVKRPPRSATASTRAGARAAWPRGVPVLRFVAGHQPTAPRMPFVLLVLGLLGGGLIGLLLLNSVAATDAFREHQLQEQTAALTTREQELSREVAAMEAPAALASRAQALGLVPAADPGYLILAPDGSDKVVGSPLPATSPPPSPTPTPVRLAAPGAQPAGQPRSSASPSSASPSQVGGRTSAGSDR